MIPPLCCWHLLFVCVVMETLGHTHPESSQVVALQAVYKDLLLSQQAGWAALLMFGLHPACCSED